jgi:hypothetical protein
MFTRHGLITSHEIMREMEALTIAPDEEYIDFMARVERLCLFRPDLFNEAQMV